MKKIVPKELTAEKKIEIANEAIAEVSRLKQEAFSAGYNKLVEETGHQLAPVIELRIGNVTGRLEIIPVKK